MIVPSRWQLCGRRSVQPAPSPPSQASWTCPFLPRRKQQQRQFNTHTHTYTHTNNVNLTHTQPQRSKLLSRETKPASCRVDPSSSVLMLTKLALARNYESRFAQTFDLKPNYLVLRVNTEPVSWVTGAVLVLNFSARWLKNRVTRQRSSHVGTADRRI